MWLAVFFQLVIFEEFNVERAVPLSLLGPMSAGEGEQRGLGWDGGVSHGSCYGRVRHAFPIWCAPVHCLQ